MCKLRVASSPSVIVIYVIIQRVLDNHDGIIWVQITTIFPDYLSFCQRNVVLLAHTGLAFTHCLEIIIRCISFVPSPMHISMASR